MAGTFVMWKQVDLVQTKDLGFQHEQVVQIDAQLARGQSQQVLNRYRQIAESSSAVQHVTGGWGGIGVEGALPNRFEAQSGNTTVKTHAWRTHHDVVETLGMTLAAGRDFSPEYGADATGQTVIVNEKLVDAFGWDDPIGKTLSVQFAVQEAEVVGVVEDIHFQSFRQQIAPLVLHMRPIAPTNQLFARIAPGQTAQALDELQHGWADTVSDLPFSPVFLDEAVEQQYQSDQRWAHIVTYAAGFALFIAGLGLFGLAALVAQQRTKEIGVRKALGARTRHIVALLSTDFARLVGIAFVLAVPAAYWGTHRWLREFAYRVDLGPWVFVGAGALALAVALGAVGAHAFRAARLDPATTLRDE
jgi:putative ABC transport system permease protein